MKLSEMNTRDAARMICSLTGPVERIAHDEKIVEQLKNKDKKTILEVLAELFSAFAPALLERHYDDALRIVSALTGKDIEAIEEQNITQTLRDVKSIMDDEFIRFFTSSANTAAEK